MEKVFFKNGYGMGIILENEKESNFFADKKIEVAEEILFSGIYTTLSGYFIKPVRFVGTLKEDDKVMVFYLGCVPNLFSIEYYLCLYYINRFRIATKLSNNTVRDFHYKNNSWK
ncbi:hypothetical protein CAPN002_00100 [Capnocytophaga stomatis]|uniref:hypothetical protein n=1 Tax=Capnocytophaga stomatis TaxID=1848904 RepID=UPI00194EA2E6|nr:hypothetical protein [Capnocytophaga stomatis]GIJ92792.1 hypothetical protein CAPN002_00100 [Capnocytophaga stomatis]